MSIAANTASHRLEVDRLEDSIIRHCHRINAATYDLLVDLREFDQRAGFLGAGFDNCVDWLHWRCDIGLSAAREKLRVAQAILVLPTISAAFAEGRLAYSKVRALTRVARKENESELVAFALKCTTAQVEQRCRELRCGTDASVDDAHRAHARRSLCTHRNPDKGTVTITLEIPTEQAILIDKALDYEESLACQGQTLPFPGVPQYPICRCPPYPSLECRRRNESRQPVVVMR